MAQVTLLLKHWNEFGDVIIEYGTMKSPQCESFSHFQTLPFLQKYFPRFDCDGLLHFLLIGCGKICQRMSLPLPGCEHKIHPHVPRILQSSIFPTILHISYNPPHLMLSLLNNSRVSCHSEAGSSKEPPLTNEPLQKAGKCEIGSTPRLPKRITWQPPISEQLPSSFSTLYSGLSKVISSLLTFAEQSLLG